MKRILLCMYARRQVGDGMRPPALMQAVRGRHRSFCQDAARHRVPHAGRDQADVERLVPIVMVRRVVADGQRVFYAHDASGVEVVLYRVVLVRA